MTNKEKLRNCNDEMLITFLLNIFNHTITRRENLCELLAERYWEQREILKEWLEREYEF